MTRTCSKLPNKHSPKISLPPAILTQNGWEAQAELATSGWRVPVIFITAQEDAAAQERAISTGAVAFLRKPFTDQCLLEAIDAAVGRGPGAGGAV